MMISFAFVAFVLPIVGLAVIIYDVIEYHARRKGCAPMALTVAGMRGFAEYCARFPAARMVVEIEDVREVCGRDYWTCQPSLSSTAGKCGV